MVLIQVGKTFPGRRGNYIITGVSPDASVYGLHQGKGTIQVKYVDGEWSGRTIPMSVQTHLTIQHNQEISRRIVIQQTKEGLEENLELWWYKHPGLYKRHWKEGISGEELVAILEAKYPQKASELMEKYE